jgi:cytoskeleton protein RodZ
MALKELGIALREAREAKNLDIEDVAIRIKVSARVLRAIEDGERDGLPHAVYARGFIKSYGALLGVDNDLVMRAVDEAYPFEVPEELLPEAVVAQPPARARTGLSPVVLALAALVLLAVLGGGWYYRQQSAREADMPKVAQPAQSAQPAQPVPPVTSVAPVAPVAADAQPASAADAAPLVNATVPAAMPGTTGVAANATNATAATSSTLAAQPGRNATAPTAAAASASTASATPAPAAVTPAAPAPAQAAASTGAPQGGVFDSEAAAGEGADTDGSVLAGGTHRIVVIALADCWVHSSADDSDVRQFSLHKGQTFALTFTKRLTLKLGNAGGVRIRYNGQEQPAPGESGQVRTLVFPPQAQ